MANPTNFSDLQVKVYFQFQKSPGYVFPDEGKGRWDSGVQASSTLWLRRLQSTLLTSPSSSASGQRRGLAVAHMSHAPLISLASTQSRGSTEPQRQQGNVACYSRKKEGLVPSLPTAHACPRLSLAWCRIYVPMQKAAQ